MIYYARWCEELILIKCLYYPKQSTDSIQLLWKYLFFPQIRTNNCKIFMEPQNIPNSQSNLQKRVGWKYVPWLQTIVQSYSNQKSMKLVKKQTYRSMKQNSEPRNKPMLYDQVIYDKEGKNIQWGKDNLFKK